MSNATTAVPTDDDDDSWGSNLNDVVSSWVLRDILPAIAAVVLILVFILGAVMHTLLLMALRRSKKLTSPSYRVLFHTSIQDILALVVIVSPNFITTCVGDWPFKHGLCVLEGILVTSFFVMSMTVNVWQTLERALKLSRSDWWVRIFEKNNGRVYIIIFIVQWIVTFIYSILPLAGVSRIKYQHYGLQCDRMHKDSKWLMNLHFVFAFGLTLLTCFCLYCIIIFQRVKQAYFNKDDSKVLVDGTHQRLPRNGDLTSSGTRRSIEDDRTSGDTRAPDFANLNRQPSATSMSHLTSSSTDVDDHVAQSSTSTSTERGRATRNKPLVQQSNSIWDIYVKQADHTLASTVVLTTSLVFLFWLPYVVVAYMYSYQNSRLSQWEGFYVIGMLFANVTYCLRPLTYVIHNKLLRADIRALFPQKVVKKYREYNEKRRETVSDIKDKLSVVNPVKQYQKHKENQRQKTDGQQTVSR